LFSPAWRSHFNILSVRVLAVTLFLKGINSFNMKLTLSKGKGVSYPPFPLQIPIPQKLYLAFATLLKVQCADIFSPMSQANLAGDTPEAALTNFYTIWRYSKKFKFLQRS